MLRVLLAYLFESSYSARNPRFQLGRFLERGDKPIARAFPGNDARLASMKEATTDFL